MVRECDFPDVRKSSFEYFEWGRSCRAVIELGTCETPSGFEAEEGLEQ